MKTAASRKARGGIAPRAFTLTELLVVIGIFVLVLAIAVPAVSSVKASNDRAQAEGQVAVALTLARDAAVRAERRTDTAAVFFYDLSSRRVRVVVCRFVGVITDLDRLNRTVEREVFAPAAEFQALELPRGYSVRGLAPAGSIDTPASVSGAGTGWYFEGSASRFDDRVSNWVFPETAFFDDQEPDDGRDRQTFMVRFEAGTGRVETGSVREVLVLDPVLGAAWRSFPVWNNAALNPERTTDLEAWARRVLSRAGFPAPYLGDADAARRALLGDEASDTVLARPVGTLAVYRHAALAAGVGVGLNANTGTFYGPQAQGEPTLDPRFDPGVVNAAALVERINAWFTRPESGAAGSVGESDALIFTIDRASGQLREVLP